MLSLELFKRRNFSVGNASTLLVYAGLGGSTFLLTLFLQEVSGYSPLAAGASLIPVTLCMFFLSRRFGALADRYGPRLFMGAGPIVAGLGLLWFSMLGANVDYLTDVLPGAILFGLGLAMTVAPLTATVLGGVDEQHAGLASGINNAIARVAGLVAIAFVGAVVSSAFSSTLDEQLAHARRTRPHRRRRFQGPRAVAEAPASLGPERPVVQAALTDASEEGFQEGMILMTVLVVLGGVLSALGIVNPERKVSCEECAGGALAGATRHRAGGGRSRLPRVRIRVPQRAGAS